MGIHKAVFYVDQPDIAHDPSNHGYAKSINEALIRERDLKVPTWTNQGKPALSKLYATLREQMLHDGVGFSGSVDLKLGCEWIQALVHVLYKLSPHHNILKRQGHPIPPRFAFSDGADDFRKKAKAIPNLLTQELLQQVTF